MDEATFREEWKDYYKKHTSDECEFMTEREIFISRILKDNGLSAEEVLFVGDSITDDILGPRAVGMKTVWVDRKGISGDVGQDGTVVTLSGLWEVIR